MSGSKMQNLFHIIESKMTFERETIPPSLYISPYLPKFTMLFILSIAVEFSLLYKHLETHDEVYSLLRE